MGSTDSSVNPGSKPSSPWIFWGKRGLAVAGAVGIVAGAITGVQQLILPLLQSDNFQGDISNLPKAADFVHFITSKDGKVIRLDVLCQEPAEGQSQCDAAPDFAPDETAGLNVLLAVYTRQSKPPKESCGSPAELNYAPPADCTGVYWMHFFVGKGVNAQITNGPTGAGSTRYHGSFSLVVQGVLGTSPKTIQNVSLSAVNPSVK
jgi:hypothetical protein